MQNNWVLYKYDSYDDYVQAQKDANIIKEKCIWVEKHAIEKIHSVLSDIEVNNIICHGTRNGKELEYFSELYPDANIVGSEISDTATKYANTVQWDFHEQHPDWINKFDIVYSNSFDHSYDPEKCLSTWKEQLSETGVLVIELQNQKPGKRSDPLSISSEAFEWLIDILGMSIKYKETGSHNVPLYFIS
jgi:hypothetical protein